MAFRIQSLILLSILVFFSKPMSLFAQDQENQWETKAFVIVASEKSYDKAKTKAVEVSKKLGYPLDLRDLSPHPKIGLTFSKEVCTQEWDSYPCYLPRGREAGKFVSVEYSSAFGSFKKGYYVVIIANDKTKSKRVIKALSDARKQGFSDAYAKTDKVYLGCMH